MRHVRAPHGSSAQNS